MEKFDRIEFGNDEFVLPKFTPEQWDEITKNGKEIIDEIERMEQERLERLTSKDKNGNSVLFFEIIYDEWLSVVKARVCERRYLKGVFETIRACDPSFIIPFDDNQFEEYSKIILDYFSADSVKWDVLMWLKAIEYSSHRGMFVADPTESLYGSVLGLGKDKTRENSFNNAKKRMNEQYEVKRLFQNYIPFFHYPLYGTSAEKENPYARMHYEINVAKFLELKDIYVGIVNNTLDNAKDEEKRLCMKIVSEYCLEATYGFAVKAEISNFIAERIDDTMVPFSKNYSALFKEKVIADIITNDSFGFDLPEKYKDLKPSDFKNNFSFLTASERMAIRKAQKRYEVEDDFSDNDSRGVPNSGYILMMVLYVKAICERLLSEYLVRIKRLEESQSNVKSALRQASKITDRLISLIDDKLLKFELSVPGSGAFTRDEIILVSETSDCDKEFLRFYKSIEEYDKNGKPNYCLNEMLLPLENYILEVFIQRVYIAFDIKERNGDHYNFNYAEIRKFKHMLLELMNNCFNVQKIFLRNPLFPNIAGEISNLEVFDDESGNVYLNHKYMFDYYGHSLDIFPVTRKLFLKRIADNESSFFLGRMIPFIVADILKGLQISLSNTYQDDEYRVSEWDYKEYITRIYNMEVMEHIQENLHNIQLDNKVSILSDEVQDIIARL